MYKTILVHVDHSARSAARIEVAARLANQYEGHLVGAAMTGLSAFMFPVSSLDVGMPPIVFPIEELRTQANAALDGFDKAASGQGVPSYERRLIDDEAGAGMALQARYSDLAVVSQAVAGEFMPLLRSDFAQYVVLHGARPVLVLPHTWSHPGAGGDIGACVTVAWNGSTEALRSITSALGVLKRARQVNLVVFDAHGAEGGHGEHGDQPGADMALYLARHGVKVQVTAISESVDAGHALLTVAQEQGADLLVMGAYGHSRLQEAVLGGATRTVLASTPLPLWLAH